MEEPDFTQYDDGFLQVLWFPPPIKLTTKIQYKSNIVESGVKHHKPKPKRRLEICFYHEYVNIIFKISYFLIQLQLATIFFHRNKINKIY